MFIHDGKGSPPASTLGDICFSGLYMLILFQFLGDAVTFEETFNSGGVLGATHRRILGFPMDSP